MIEITYNRSKPEVTVTGHAGIGAKGHDIVCAGVSAITYTLAADVDALCGDHRKARDKRVILGSGDARISCRPVHGFANVVTLIFDSVCMGYKLIADRYPDVVRYTVKG